MIMHLRHEYIFTWYYIILYLQPSIKRLLNVIGICEKKFVGKHIIHSVFASRKQIRLVKNRLYNDETRFVSDFRTMIKENLKSWMFTQYL
jgi:hypothetical protein